MRHGIEVLALRRCARQSDNHAWSGVRELPAQTDDPKVSLKCRLRYGIPGVLLSKRVAISAHCGRPIDVEDEPSGCRHSRENGERIRGK